MTTKAFGEEGFRWFIGVVEDRDDPKKEGRVKVRAHGIHGTPIEAPTKDLPWAPILMPGFSASLKQIGSSATGVQVGSTVFGFFLDGEEATLPIVFGVLPGIGDITKLATGQNTLNKEKVGSEPESAYNAKYPYNKVFQSESGHVIEIDDTPNFERLHTYHRSGTYTEIDHDGRRVNKIVGDDFEIVQKDKDVFITGNLNIQAQGGVSITSPNVSITGNLSVSGSITGAEVTGAGIGLSTHTHSDPQGGTVGAPQG